MQFNDRLKSLMRAQGVTAYKLSKEVGCVPQTVANWLAGSVPGSDKLQALAGYFGVSTDYLMGADDTDTAEDAEKMEILEDIRRNPELRAMFSVARDATPEEIRQYTKIIKALRNEE